MVLGAGQLDRYDVELVDTPGTGSVFEHNTVAAQDALSTLDAAIFVVTADPPISATERDLLREVSNRSLRTFIVLNKADQLADDDLRQAEGVHRGGLLGSHRRTHAGVCLLSPSRSADAGYASFRDEFERYLASSAHDDIEIALRGHVSRLAGGMLDAAVLTERSLQLAETDSADRVALFQARIADMAGRGQDVEDRCWAIERGLRRSLDQSAAQLSTRLIEAAAPKPPPPSPANCSHSSLKTSKSAGVLSSSTSFASRSTAGGPSRRTCSRRGSARSASESPLTCNGRLRTARRRP